ncbi:uncharacterized protein [Notamacropus eugenii]|uniref:uncharacterized protein n=1 Tax=Notamacropus eugenii TaxID=9315 RepID=UPI003B67A8DA
MTAEALGQRDWKRESRTTRGCRGRGEEWGKGEGAGTEERVGRGRGRGGREDKAGSAAGRRRGQPARGRGLRLVTRPPREGEGGEKRTGRGGGRGRGTTPTHAREAAPGRRLGPLSASLPLAGHPAHRNCLDPAAPADPCRRHFLPDLDPGSPPPSDASLPRPPLETPSPFLPLPDPSRGGPRQWSRRKCACPQETTAPLPIPLPRAAGSRGGKVGDPFLETGRSPSARLRGCPPPRVGGAATPPSARQFLHPPRRAPSPPSRVLPAPLLRRRAGGVGWGAISSPAPTRMECARRGGGGGTCRRPPFPGGEVGGGAYERSPLPSFPPPLPGRRGGGGACQCPPPPGGGRGAGGGERRPGCGRRIQGQARSRSGSPARPDHVRSGLPGARQERLTAGAAPALPSRVSSGAPGASGKIWQFNTPPQQLSRNWRRKCLSWNEASAANLVPG